MKLKDLNPKETLEELFNKALSLAKLYAIFNPKYAAVIPAVSTVYDTIQSKEVSKLTIEDVVKIAETYQTVKPLFDKKSTVNQEEIKPVVTETEVKEIDIEETDIDKIKVLTWLDSGDGAGEHGSIIRIYDDNPFNCIANLPIDFSCTLNNGGCSITIPDSDTTRNMSDAGERRAFVCLFNSSGQLVCTEDFNGTGIDNRWRDKGATQGFVVHILNNRITSRTKLTEVK
jgi:hypothetical protein